MSFLQDKVYPHLPVFAQNLAISAFGYQWYRRRFSGVFESEYNACRQREAYTAQQWHQWQTQQLRTLLVHAFEQVPYYREAFARAGFSTSRLQKIELHQLPQLPPLEKDTVRKLGKTTLLAAQRQPSGSFFSSSGSTGTPTSILYSHQMHQKISAFYEARVRNWAGVSRHHARGMIGGRRILPQGQAKPPYYRYNFVEKQVYFSAYHINRHTAANYLQGLQQHHTQYMVGYAMSNYFLARFLQEAGLQPPQMKAVLTSSEKLTPTMRQVMEQVYQCRVFDAWSGVENCGLISESEHGQLLVSPDAGYLEILKPDGTPAAPGEEGELLCTGFLNYDQPLIRYKIGDVVRLSANQQTLCGRAFTVVDEIIGRSEDVVVGADGREMVRFHGIFVNLPNVLKGQVVQETLTTFTVNVMTPGLTLNEKETIVARMQSQLGNVQVTVQEMPHIPVGSNGKFRAVISKVKRQTPVMNATTQP